MNSEVREILKGECRRRFLEYLDECLVLESIDTRLLSERSIQQFRSLMEKQVRRLFEV